MLSEFSKLRHPNLVEFVGFTKREGDSDPRIQHVASFSMVSRVILERSC